MSFRRRLCLVLAACAVVVVGFNFYFLHVHSAAQQQQQRTTTRGRSKVKGRTGEPPSLAQRIEARWLTLPSRRGPTEPVVTFDLDPRPLDPDLRPLDPGSAWALAGGWVGPRQVYPREAPLLGVLGAMAAAPVTRAAVGTGGTQLKMTLTLRGGQRAVFKPMRYPRDAVFTDTPYAGADRHNGEIAAFHLSRLLNLRWVPLAVGRKLNLRTEVLPVADKALKDTFFQEGNSTCFYGSCYYCKREEPACGRGDVLEGALILWLPQNLKLKMHRHPWRRLYKKDALAPWEVNDAFCERVRGSRTYGVGSRLLDLIDISVFDFLIGNADRHRYEVFQAFEDSMVILLDNGKSFGNPDKDELSILAPLYQCCQIRRSTYEMLSDLPEGPLSSALLRLSARDPLHPLLTEAHLTALDRRRAKVLDVVEFCLEEHPRATVMS